jgi:hypothetical protein
LLNYHDQELTLDHLLGTDWHSAIEADKPEPRHTVRTLAVLKLAEGRGGIGDGIKAFEDIDSNEQRGATASNGL